MLRGVYSYLLVQDHIHAGCFFLSKPGDSATPRAAGGGATRRTGGNNTAIYAAYPWGRVSSLESTDDELVTVERCDGLNACSSAAAKGAQERFPRRTS